MRIAILADDKKKELMAQFCIAYCGILNCHSICATAGTGKYVADATGLNIELMLDGSSGGVEQIESRISFDEIDVVLFFRGLDQQFQFEVPKKSDISLLRMCDMRNIPVATNIATAEVIIRALDTGDLDYREFINPTSKYNIQKKVGEHNV